MQRDSCLTEWHGPESLSQGGLEQLRHERIIAEIHMKCTYSTPKFFITISLVV